MARKSGHVVAFMAGLLVLVSALGGFLLWNRSGGGPESAGRSDEAVRRPSLLASDVDLDRSQPAGALEGKVVDADGRPVDGATVVLVRTPSREGPPAPNMGRPLQVVTTGGGGVFRMAEVAPGAYSLTAMAARNAPGQRTPVEVLSGKTASAEIQLGKGGLLLRGRVLDASGGTVPGAKVMAREFVMGTAGVPAAPRVLQTKADDNGNYQLFLGKAQYSLNAEADGYAPAFDWFMLTADTTRDLRLSPASRIAGRVIERGTRKPVADAELWVVMHRSGVGGSRPRDVKSDSEGGFSFNDLEPGSYRVGARKGRLVGMSTPVPVAMAQAVADVEVEVHPGFVIAGRTLDGTGKPVSGARIDLFKNQPPMDRPLFARTGADGKFQIEGVLPAEFRLSTRAEGFAPVRQELKVTGDVPNLELRLGAEALVSGRVLSAQGQPVEGANVNIMVRTRGGMGSGDRAVTGADGSFQIKGLTAGDLSVTATHAQGVANVKDDKLADAEKKVLTLKLAPGGSIAGTIKLDDGRPAPGARIEAQSWGEGGAGRWNETSAADGSYRLTGLSAGRIVIVASSGSSMRWGGPDRPDQKTITLAEQEHKTGVDLVVAGAKTIAGVVVDPDGKPVAGAEVTAGLEGPEGRAFRRTGMGMDARAFTQGDGTFTLERLAAGKHTVWAVNAGFSDAEVKGIEGGATGVKLQFPPEATIAGLVTGADGQPVSNYTISLAPGPKPGETPMEKRQRQMSSAWDSPSDTVHDPSGRFLLRRVSEGTHELRARTVDGSAATLVISIGPGERKQGVRIVLERGARIVGKVMDSENNQPLADVEVRAFSPSMVNRSPARTDAGGAFAIDGVGAGENVQIMFMGDRKVYLMERRVAEIPKGSTQADLGIIKLMRGNMEARMKEGTWQGLTGITNSEDDKATVTMARPGGPAAKAGIKAGDAILSIDGKDMRGFGSGGIEYHLRGKPGTSVTMTVQTPGEPPRTVTFNRISTQEQQQLSQQQQSQQQQQARTAAPAAQR